jgi:predicted transcriptional regulator
MKLSAVKDALNAGVLYGEEQLNKTVRSAGGADLMNAVLATGSKGAVLLTGLNTVDVILTANKANIAAVVFVRGKMPTAEALELAQQFQIPLLRTSLSLFVACGRLYMVGLRGLDGSW